MRCFQVDVELEARRAFDGEVGGLRSFQDLIHESRRALVHLGEVDPIRHETTNLYVLPGAVHRRQPILISEGEGRDPVSLGEEERVQEHVKRVCAGSRRRECVIELVGEPHSLRMKLRPKRPGRALELLQCRNVRWIARIPKDGDPGGLSSRHMPLVCPTACGQGPECEQREHPVRCRAGLGSVVSEP